MLLTQVVCNAQEVIFKHLNTYSQSQGLNGTNIHKIIQDSYGFLWISTQDGLNRFDGKNFTVYNINYPPERALLSNDIRDLIIDSARHILWVICNQGGINGIDIVTGEVKYAFVYNNKLLSDSWRICAVMVNKKIYIGTSSGIDVFNTATLNFELCEPLTSALKAASLIPDIRAIAVDGRDNIWLGLAHFGIAVFNPLEQKSVRITPVDRFSKEETFKNFWPRCILFSQNGWCWMSTDMGLYRIKYSGDYSIGLSEKLSLLKVSDFQEVSHMLIGKSGELIIPGASSIIFYDVDKKNSHEVRPANRETIPWLNNSTYCFEDRQQNLWLGTKQGLVLVKHNELPFNPIKNSEAYLNKLGHVFSVLPIDGGKILAGTQEGLFLIKGSSVKTVYGKRLVQNLFRLTDKDILVSGSSGISLYEDEKLVPIEKKYPEFRPYISTQLNSAGFINDSLTIIGTESNYGILLWNRRKHLIKNTRSFTLPRRYAVGSDNVNSVFITSDKKAVVLSDFCLSVFNPVDSAFTKITFKDSHTGTPIGIFMAIVETKDYFWLSTYGQGLIRLTKDYRKIKIYGNSHGLLNTGLYKIFNYHDSLFYLTGNFGMSVFNKDSEEFENYFEEDGLQGNTFEEACGDTLNGKIYAGGVNGFVEINPALYHPDDHIPDLYFTKVITLRPNESLLDAEDNSNTKFIDLKNTFCTIGNDVIQTNIYFSGINFINPKRVVYAYKIDEIKSDWITLGNQNEIQLIGIPPGVYHIRIKASSQYNKWSGSKELILEFNPKWYQRWWVKLLTVCIIAGAVYLAFRLRISTLQKQHEIRKSIGRDLHDSLGGTLNSAKIFANLALMGVESQENLLLVKSSLDQATTELRDMLWVLDDSQDNVEVLVARLNQYAIPVSAAIHINTSIKADFDASKRGLSKKEKRNLLLVCKEAINNSIKYSKGTDLKLLITRQQNNKLRLSIMDNGIGFNAEDITSGYGLANMKSRMKEINYRLAISSEIGKGTSIEINEI